VLKWRCKHVFLAQPRNCLLVPSLNYAFSSEMFCSGSWGLSHLIALSSPLIGAEYMALISDRPFYSSSDSRFSPIDPLER